MKIMINRQPRKHAWGGGTHFVTCLSRYLCAVGHDVVHALEDEVVLIFMIDPRPEIGGDDVNHIYSYKTKNPDCKIIHRVNDTDIARNTHFLDDIIIQSNAVADYTIFISQWVKDYYIQKGMAVDPCRNHVIINGCDEEWYYPKEENLIGQKVRLVTHHWSDNFMKGFDLYNFLDVLCRDRDDLEFTYMGRYNKQYVPKNTRLVPPSYGPIVCEILRDHDIYVTAARWEACGMHHIEGSACGLPVIYHKDGGAIPEVCKDHGLQFECQDSFLKCLKEVTENYQSYREKIDYKKLSMNKCLLEYYNVVSSVTGKK